MLSRVRMMLGLRSCISSGSRRGVWWNFGIWVSQLSKIHRTNMERSDEVPYAAGVGAHYPKLEHTEDLFHAARRENGDHCRTECIGRVPYRESASPNVEHAASSAAERVFI